eukprot:4720978-Heterocapsa_arctica.AAC.1
MGDPTPAAMALFISPQAVLDWAFPGEPSSVGSSILELLGSPATCTEAADIFSADWERISGEVRIVSASPLAWIGKHPEGAFGNPLVKVALTPTQ